MKAYLLDTTSLLAFLENTPGADFVEDILWKAVQEKHRLCVPVTNWCEALSLICRSRGKHTADEVQTRLHLLPIELISIDAPIAKAALALSVKQSLPYHECLPIAAAHQRKAILVTTKSGLLNAELGVKVQLAS